jgi:hypothetical protein
MADLMVHEPLSLEELHAETCLALPERDLMQNLNVNLNVNGSASASSVFSTAAAFGVILLVNGGPGA